MLNGRNIFIWCSQIGVMCKLCKQLIQQLSIKKQTTLLKSRQKTWIDIFPKKTHRRPTGANHKRGKKITRGITSHLLGRSSSKVQTTEAGDDVERSCLLLLSRFSRVQLSVTPWIVVYQASLSITNSRSVFKLMSIELVMPSNHLIFCRPLLLLLSIFPSIRVFSNESALCITWPKYCSFSFNISPSHEHPELISFWMDWFDLLAVQGTLRGLLQHHNLKTSILRCLALFMVQLSHLCLNTGKTKRFDYTDLCWQSNVSAF